jgi:hypothetical protein
MDAEAAVAVPRMAATFRSQLLFEHVAPADQLRGSRGRHGAVGGMRSTSRVIVLQVDPLVGRHELAEDAVWARPADALMLLSFATFHPFDHGRQ